MNTNEFQQIRDAWTDVPEPSAQTRQAVRRRLEATIASDTQPRARRRYRPQTLLAAALLLGLLGAVFQRHRL